MDSIKKEDIPAKECPLKYRKPRIVHNQKIANSTSISNVYSLGKGLAEIENTLISSSLLFPIVRESLISNLTLFEISAFFEAYNKFREVK